MSKFALGNEKFEDFDLNIEKPPKITLGYWGFKGRA